MSSAINEDDIQALIKNFSSVGKNVDVVKTRTTPDFRFIRPSGNPLDAAGFAHMFASGDLVMQSIGLSKVHRLDVYDDRAFAPLRKLQRSLTRVSQTMTFLPSQLFLKR